MLTMKTHDYFQIMSLFILMYHDQISKSLVWRKQKINPSLDNDPNKNKMAYSTIYQ